MWRGMTQWSDCSEAVGAVSAQSCDQSDAMSWTTVVPSRRHSLWSAESRQGPEVDGAAGHRYRLPASRPDQG